MTKHFTTADGITGRLVNPFGRFIEFNQKGYDDFKAANPEYPIHPSPIEKGDFQGELVWQYETIAGVWETEIDSEMHDMSKLLGLKTRQAIQVVDTLNASLSEMMHCQAEEREEQHDTDVALLSEKKDSVEEAGIVDTPQWKDGVEFLETCMVTDEDERFLRFYDFIAGWHKGHAHASANMVELEKVLEVLELHKFHYLNSVKITEIITQIKQLTIKE